MNNACKIKCAKCSIHPLQWNCDPDEPVFSLLTNCMDGQGSIDTAQILIIGEAPGAEEDAAHRAFVGPYSQILARVLKKAGVNSRDIRVTYAVRCRPVKAVTDEQRLRYTQQYWENRSATTSELAECSHWLRDEIKSMPNLRVIVPMGNAALFALEWTGREEKIPTRIPPRIAKVRGLQIPYGNNTVISVVPTYAPGYLAKNPQFEDSIVKDFELAKNLITGAVKPAIKTTYKEVRTLEEFDELINVIKEAGEVAWDTETTSKDYFFSPQKILSFSFSSKIAEAYYLPWWESGELTDIGRIKNFWYEKFGYTGYKHVYDGLKDIFESPDIKKIGQNMKFDAKFIYASAGITETGELCRMGIDMVNWYFDTMIAHHMLFEDLPHHDLKSMAKEWTDLGDYDSELDEFKKKLKATIELQNKCSVAAKEYLELYKTCKESGKPIKLPPKCLLEYNIVKEGESKKDRIVDVDLLQTIVDNSLEGVELHYGMIQLQDIIPYAMMDADATFRLYKIFAPKLKEQELETVFYHLRMPISKVLAKAEINGVCIDIPLALNMSETLKQKQEEIERRIKEVACKEINLASPAQLREFLYTDLHLPVLDYTETGEASTNKKTLDRLATQTNNESLRDIITWRHFHQVRNTFLEGLLDKIDPVTSKLHPGFLVAKAATQRVVCAKPNLLNIPRDDPNDPEFRVRKIFVPETPQEEEDTTIGDRHVFVDGDLSQAELRVFASLSNDKQLAKMFEDGIDIHAYFANIVYHHNLDISELGQFKKDPVMKEQRSRTKSMVFGTLYGQNAKGAERSFGMPEAEAQEIINVFYRLCPDGEAWIKGQHAFAQKYGYVKTPLGVIRHLPILLQKETPENRYLRAEALRISVNTVIQTHASDYACIALLDLVNKLNNANIWYEVKLIIYDAIIVECMLKDALKVKELQHQAMTAPRVGYNIPMAADMELIDRWSGNEIDVEKSLAEGEIVVKVDS